MVVTAAMDESPTLYSLDSTMIIEDTSCKCELTEDDTPVPSIHCSWDSDDTFFYLSFAAPTFSVVYVILQRGFLR